MIVCHWLPRLASLSVLGSGNREAQLQLLLRTTDRPATSVDVVANRLRRLVRLQRRIESSSPDSFQQKTCHRQRVLDIQLSRSTALADSSSRHVCGVHPTVNRVQMTVLLPLSTPDPPRAVRA